MFYNINIICFVKNKSCRFVETKIKIMQREEVKIIKFKVIKDFPCSLHEVGDTIEVYSTTCRAYVTEEEKFDLRDYPHIYEQIKE